MAKCKSTWLEMQESGVQFPVRPPCGWVKVLTHTLKHVLEPAQTDITFKDMECVQHKSDTKQLQIFCKKPTFSKSKLFTKTEDRAGFQPGKCGFSVCYLIHWATKIDIDFDQYKNHDNTLKSPCCDVLP